MKKLMILLVACLLIPGVLGTSLSIDKVSSDEHLIRDSGEPAVFKLNITNEGESGVFDFFTYVSSKIEPDSVELDSGETKQVDVKIYGLERITKDDSFAFSFYIKDEEGEKIKKNFLVNIKELNDALEIGAGELTPASNMVEVYVENKVNYNFDNLEMNISSPFFNMEESFSLPSSERKSLEVELSDKDFGKLFAGTYSMNADFNYEDSEASLSSVIDFEEKKIIKTSKSGEGFLVREDIIEKRNEGNVEATSAVNMQRNIISRMFTTFNKKPDVVERSGAIINYSWSEKLEPGEKSQVVMTTNWFYPLIIVLILVGITIFIKKRMERDVLLRKKISFVKAKGGEFALKVSLMVQAKSYVEKVNVVDRVPNLVKLYEKKFGGEKPSEVDTKKGRVKWELGEMRGGEERTLTYVVYSKIGVLGKFALPSATAFYEKQGKLNESISNRTYFVSEQTSEKESD